MTTIQDLELRVTALEDTLIRLHTVLHVHGQPLERTENKTSKAEATQ